MPTQPTQRITLAGVKRIAIYPYGGAYDDTTAEDFFGLQSADISITSTVAEGFGGEHIWRQFAAETKREVDVKLAAFDTTLRSIQILQGGDFNIDATNGALGEVQYLAPNKSDHAPYFRLLIQADNGTGLFSTIFPKCMIDGAISLGFKADGIMIPDFSCKCNYDPTFVRQDGKTGGAYGVFYGAGGQSTRHS